MFACAHRSAAVDDDIEHTAHDRQVLQKIVHLVLHLGCRRCPEIVEYESRRNEEEEQDNRSPPGTPAESEHQPGSELQQNGERQQKRNQGHAFACHVAGCPGITHDLACSGNNKEKVQEAAANEGSESV